MSTGFGVKGRVLEGVIRVDVHVKSTALISVSFAVFIEPLTAALFSFGDGC